ncbi:hypothetical protein BaRGS_00018381 [Batillaria attramentaria]|uniref:G-protein coupled receptors family 1 profile domain-containing protein n=1 Tax=Batillaria attramentaria TaxID=370345 RepID=A0ABD0KTA4_9CAEN
MADMAIGVLSIPPYIPYLLTGRWTAGYAYCKFWLLWDYITPAASTFSMCVISLDRYLLVAYPIWYRQHQSTRFLLLMVLMPWVIPTTVYAPSILLWETISGEETIREGQCYVPYAYNLPFLLFGSAVEFIIPLLIMGSLNFLVFLNIRRRTRKRISSSLAVLKEVPSIQPEPSQGSTRVHPLQVTHNKPLSIHEVESISRSVAARERETTDARFDTQPGSEFAVSQRQTSTRFKNEVGPSADKGQAKPQPRKSPKAARRVTETAVSPRNRASAINLQRDRKAARALFILVFVFALCWMPYEILALITAVCPTCIDKNLFEFSFWLLWFNSTINPILYPLLHKRFRDAFLSILKSCKCCE